MNILTLNAVQLLNVPIRKNMKQNLLFTSNHQMPKVKPYNGEIPLEINSFNRMKNQVSRDNSFLHFYIDDQLFKCVLEKPKKYLKILKRFAGVISTDFSVYADMNMQEVRYNSYLNKLLAAWWQENGISVIPNVSWSREWSYDFCFDGFPKNSFIAINSTGVGRDKFSKQLWVEGYKKALETLEPTHILRYGAKQQGEEESISTYYPNDNYKSVHYGR